MMRPVILSLLLTLLLFTSPVAQPSTILIDDFENGLAPGWEVESFVGQTGYTVIVENDNHVLAADSRGTASGLFFKRGVDLEHFPLLTWRWKIEATVPGGDVRSKATDDYAARVYVVFPHWFFMKTRSINYIWANRLPVGEITASPYTTNSQMVAVESGTNLAGTWQSERRNVFEDYRQIFGEEPRRVGAVAIMTDSDNTGTSAQAWYDDIRFTAE